MKKKVFIGLGVFFVLFVIVGIIAVATDSEGDGTPEPKDVLPIAVSDFNLVSVTPQRANPGAVEAELTTAYFEPSYGSKYWGEVEELAIEVIRYENEAACTTTYNYNLERGWFSDIWVDGAAILNYVELDGFGLAYAYAQRGRLLLYSDASSPLDATDINEQLLKDAATAGLEAVQSMLSSQ